AAPSLPPPAVVAAAPQGQQPVPSGGGPARLVWFGNHGAEHGRFGMLDLLEWREALETLAAERPIELVVISNHREKYEKHIRPLAVPSRYLEWSPGIVEAWLRDAAAVLIPNSCDPFSICKSANRSVLALGRGRPVIVTMTPALQPLADHLESGDPLAALRRVLDDPAAAGARAAGGSRRAEQLFGARALQEHWLRVLETGTVRADDSGQGPFLAVLLHLVQDLDLALPILREAGASQVPSEAWCTTDLLKKSPRVLVTLKAQGVAFRVLPDEDALQSFVFPARTRALLTVAETTLSPHRIPRLLTGLAIRQGRFAATLQHGFENVGLTYEDDLHTLEKVAISAQRIYTWGPEHTLHPRLAEAVRARCLPVGCPKDERVPAAELGALLPAGRPVIGIFENLHWHRYTDDYRAAFLESVQHLARAYPDLCFLVKPHHAGVWLSHRYKGDLPVADNLIIANPHAREWERHTATALLPHLSAVITTPSTVALDAARQGLPVAVFAGDLQIDNYRPLPRLRGTADWAGFIAQALDTEGHRVLEEQAGEFVARVLIPGNAAERIVHDLHRTAAAVATP
ncbi:MAG TPA: hypothetical protein VNB23_05560, partial [Ramlibacter sp.]|nr:hypothetical protein [Ramlibacter sp.]